MDFKLSKLRDWSKRSGEGRRHNCAVLPLLYRIPGGIPRTKRPWCSSLEHRGQITQNLDIQREVSQKFPSSACRTACSSRPSKGISRAFRSSGADAALYSTQCRHVAMAAPEK